MEAALVAKDACAWPVLTRLSPGLLGIVHFNRPSHGLMEGSLVALVSRDDGRSWERAGIPAPNPPGENRMHIATGVDHDGTWFVLSTGFSLVDGKLSRLQRPWIFRRRIDSKS